MNMEQAEFTELLEAIRLAYGYDFSNYSEASLKRRITNVLKTRKINSLAELRELLLNKEDEFEQFIQAVTVNVTEMFRNPLFYQRVREKVLDRLATYSVIRIWIAGCATGEEVYSVAILLQEAGLLQRSIIYATDINQKALKQAREGLVPIEKMQLYTTNYLQAGGKESFSKYYIAKYGNVLLDKSLRENVVFSVHNLTVDKSFNEFQLILCRNVMIYFNQELQNRTIKLFYESLCPFGFLALGNKESLLFSDKQHCFDIVDKREKIFRKTKINCGD